MLTKREKLKKSLGKVEIFALAFGTMIGWGSFVLPSQWIASGGVLGAVISFILATIMCLLVGLTYAELTSAFPVAGGELTFTYRAFGNIGAWFTGWNISLAYISVAAWEGIALKIALNYVFPLKESIYLFEVFDIKVKFSWLAVGVIGAIILTILNIIGVRQVAVFQILLVLVMIVSGLIYFFGGMAFGEVPKGEPIITDLEGVGSILIMTPSMFIGFDMISKSAEEMNMPLRNIGKIITLSICMAGVWYILMILATHFLTPAGSLNGNGTVMEVAIGAFQSKYIGKMIAIGAICGIITSWNGFIVGASRIIFALGRAKMLPKVFGIIHPKYKTPIVSILSVGLICCISPFLGDKAFIWFVNIAAFGTVISYLLISISFMIIRKNEPDLRREYSIKHWKVVGVIAIASASFFLFWYAPLGLTAFEWPFEGRIIAVWMLLGLVLFIISKIMEKKNSNIALERERLIFGEEFMRDMDD